MEFVDSGENENSERVIMVNVVVGLVESSQKWSMPKYNWNWG